MKKKTFFIFLVVSMIVTIFCPQTNGQKGCNNGRLSWSFRGGQVNQIDYDRMDNKKYTELNFLMRYKHENSKLGLIASGRVIGDSSASVAGGVSLFLQNATFDFLVGPKYFTNDRAQKETVAEFQMRTYYAPSDNFELRGFLYAADAISGRGDLLYYIEKNYWFAGGLTAESDYGYGVVVQVSPTKNIDILGRVMTTGQKDSRERYKLTTRIEAVLTF